MENNVKYFSCEINYNENYIPPRCRKERIRERIEVITLSVPMILHTDAPISFSHSNCGFPRRVTYRMWNGSLYKRAVSRKDNGWGEEPTFKWMTISDLRQHLSRCRTYYCTHDETVCDAVKMADNYLIIDGGVWEKVGEPRYVVMTFGLGHNHGGTALMIDNDYNHNISGSRYFNALHGDDAMNEAIRIAKGRGDTDYVKSIRSAWRIKVHTPETVRFDPAKDTGPGDDFINRLDQIASAAPDKISAALMVMGETLKQIS